jgi:GntR family transcriptional regulator
METMPGRLDPLSDTPLYKQIAARLRDQIEECVLKPGASLPSESSLMERYGAARGTVRQALGLLRSEGSITVARGRGAFVRDRAPVRRLGHDRFSRAHRAAGQSAFLAELKAQGMEPEVEVLEVGPRRAPADVARRLALRAGAKVLIRRRRYLADAHPVELATSYLPWRLAEGSLMTESNPGPGGIYARLEEAGHRLAYFAEDLTARMPLPEEAKALALGGGVPVIHLIRTAYDADDQAVEVCDTLMAADSFILSYRLPAD